LPPPACRAGSIAPERCAGDRLGPSRARAGVLATAMLDRSPLYTCASEMLWAADRHRSAFR
jgi:hypothetical protein